MLPARAGRAASCASGERHDDLLDGLIYHGATTLPFEPDAVVQCLRQLIRAGTDTSTGLITSLLYRLLDNNATLWSLVVDDPSLVGAAVEGSLLLGSCGLGLTEELLHGAEEAGDLSSRLGIHACWGAHSP